MTDREMLDLAAKAAGLWDAENRCVDIPWNPLNNDGDALRLAVDLEIAVHASARGCSVSWIVPQGQRISTVLNTTIGGDSAMSTRRAITGAAAEIGRRMES